MKISIHLHAEARMQERGATREEVIATVEGGEQFPAKYDRCGFRRNFVYNKQWRGRFYANKLIEAIAVEQADGWLVITVLVKFY